MLRLTDISKKFGAVQALNNASLGLAPGEIRAFLGANGSGKSTMVKILSGLVQRDTGTIILDDQPIETGDPKKARANGIIAAYQDMTLIPSLTIEENIAFGHEKCGFMGWVDKKARRTLAEKMIDLVGIPAMADTLVEQLDPSLCALVEFAKALSWNPKYLLVDEITACLHKAQVEKLFTLLRKLSAEGVGILFVSHRLDEVFKLCSSATILRSGKTVVELVLSDVDEDDLVYYMTGERPFRACLYNEVSNISGKEGIPSLEAKNIVIGRHVKDVSVKIHPGEIVGVAGLQGQGQSQFLRGIYGFQSIDSGEVYIHGKKIRLKNPADAIKAGIGFLPGDRQKEGIFSGRPLSENIFVARDGIRFPISWDTKSKSARETVNIINLLKVVAAGPFSPAASLSGGNQQKLIVGRWITMDLNVLVLDDPTKGVDVSSRKEIHSILREMAQKGVSLLFSSSDNEELLEISDRILVFYDGLIHAELDCDDMSADRLASLTLGIVKEGVIKG